MLPSLSGCADDEEPGISRIEWEDHDMRAGQFLNALINGDFTIAAEGFDEEMTRLLGVRGLRRAWRDTVRVAGAYTSVLDMSYMEHEGYDIYDIVTQHRNRSINTRVVFSEDGLVAGLFFTFV